MYNWSKSVYYLRNYNEKVSYFNGFFFHISPIENGKKVSSDADGHQNVYYAKHCQSSRIFHTSF
jgi:hypothetical protein